MFIVIINTYVLNIYVHRFLSPFLLLILLRDWGQEEVKVRVSRSGHSREAELDPEWWALRLSANVLVPVFIHVSINSFVRQTEQFYYYYLTVEGTKSKREEVTCSRSLRHYVGGLPLTQPCPSDSTARALLNCVTIACLSCPSLWGRKQTGAFWR